MLGTIRESLLREVLEGHVKLVGLTVGQYHELVESRSLAENTSTELIDGLIVRKDRSHLGEDPMTVGRAHAWVITQLAKLAPAVAAQGGLLRMQLPISLSQGDEPEPDAAIVRADPNDYADGHPCAADVFCLIEVADSSLEYDRVPKQRIYADAGIQFYFIINLLEKVIETYAQPLVGRGSYAAVGRVSSGELVHFPGGASNAIDVRVDQFLPKVQ